MGWSFRKSIRLGKGLRINVSRRGIGWSIGSKLLRFGVSGGRARVSSGIGPVRYQKTLPNRAPARGCGYSSLAVVGIGVIAMVVASQIGSRSGSSPPRGSSPAPSARAQPLLHSIKNTVTTSPLISDSVLSTPRPLPTGPAAEAAKQRAVKRYPQLAVAGSPLNVAFVERVRRYQRERPEIFDDAEWPSIIARECASR